MISRQFISVAILLICAGNVNAALLERLGGLAYYDTSADLTWLADANYAQTSGYDTDGRMSWDQANAWADNLEIQGVTGWRLSGTDTSCSGFNCTNTELADLFYNVLGGEAGSSISLQHNSNYDLFSNILPYNYWLDALSDSDPTQAWILNFSNGGEQALNDVVDGRYAWAVHTGDVAPVPVPAAVWLFVSGFLSLLGVARRKA